MGMPVYEAIRRCGLLVDQPYHELVLDNGEHLRDHVMDGIMSSVRVNCQNIANLVASGGAPAIRDMPGAVCPWPDAWFEFRSSDDIPLAGLVRAGRVGGERMQKIAADLAVSTSEDTISLAPGLPDDAFMHVLYTVMDLGGAGYSPYLMGWTMWFAHANGDPVLNPEGRFVNFYRGGDVGREPSQYVSRVVALSCVFANCQNVTLVGEGGLWPSRQTRRAAERRGEEPPVTFHTLRINPNATRKQGAGTGTSGRELSLHIVRGHFATYTDERKLFGKHTGTFWIPAHVRGSEDVGIVGKDYAIDR